MTILSFLVFYLFILLSFNDANLISDRFSIIRTKSANLSDYDSFLIYSNNVDRMKCLSICQLAPKCRTALFFKESSTCKLYKITEYFSNDVKWCKRLTQVSMFHRKKIQRLL